ncbi:MAG: hypothetical protein IH596_05835 [Bacteroidales bacterium]|nr:hypothetical protein [Bacteroidales bacterium]
MKTGKLILVVLIVSTVGVLSCRKMEQPKEENGIQKSMEEINVDPNFNWETTKAVEVILTGNKTGVIKIKPVEGDFYYHKGLLSVGNTYKTEISVPTSVKEVILVFQGNTYTVPISGNQLNFSFNK